MTKLDQGYFNDTPDTVPEQAPVTPGIYEMEIVGVPTLKLTKKGDHQLITAKLMILDDGDFQGRKIIDYICLNDFGKVKAKNLIQSAGMSPDDGLDLEELAGATVTADIKNEPYQSNDIDPETGTAVMKTSSRIKKYVVK